MTAARAARRLAGLASTRGVPGVAFSALLSAIACAAVAWRLSPVHDAQAAALSHELEFVRDVPERALERFVQACTTGDFELAEALSTGATPLPEACPPFRDAIEPELWFEQAAQRPGGLELVARVTIGRSTHRLRATLVQTPGGARVAR